MLSEKEMQEAAGDVSRMILASGRIAKVFRKTTGESLYGSDDAQHTEIAQFPVELLDTPPIELAGKVDAIASVLPDSDVKQEDRVMIQGSTFRVQTAKPENLFGCVTHLSLQLVKLS